MRIRSTKRGGACGCGQSDTIYYALESSIIQSSLSSHSGWVMGVKWSPVDPHRLLTGSYDSTLRLWDTRSTKKPLFSVAAHEGKVLCCDWSDPKVSKHKIKIFGVKILSTREVSSSQEI